MSNKRETGREATTKEKKSEEEKEERKDEKKKTDRQHKIKKTQKRERGATDNLSQPFLPFPFPPLYPSHSSHSCSFSPFHSSHTFSSPTCHKPRTRITSLTTHHSHAFPFPSSSLLFPFHQPFSVFSTSLTFLPLFSFSLYAYYLFLLPPFILALYLNFPRFPLFFCPFSFSFLYFIIITNVSPFPFYSLPIPFLSYLLFLYPYHFSLPPIHPSLPCTSFFSLSPISVYFSTPLSPLCLSSPHIPPP